MVNLVSSLLAIAKRYDITANKTVETHYDDGGATAFFIADGTIGDDTIGEFKRDDSIITTRKLFDGNGDGLIDFGKNQMLDVDRINSRKAGEDQLKIEWTEGQTIGALRYLGERDGQHAYGDYATLREFKARYKGVENSVADDSFKMKDTALFIDSLLGLNLGNDMVSGTVSHIVTTTRLVDMDDDGQVDNYHWSVDGSGRLDIVGDDENGTNLGSVTFAQGGHSLVLTSTEYFDGYVFYTYDFG